MSSNSPRCTAPDCPNNKVIRGYCLQHQSLVHGNNTPSNNMSISSNPSPPPKPVRYQSQSSSPNNSFPPPSSSSSSSNSIPPPQPPPGSPPIVSTPAPLVMPPPPLQIQRLAPPIPSTSNKISVNVNNNNNNSNNNFSLPPPLPPFNVSSLPPSSLPPRPAERPPQPIFEEEPGGSTTNGAYQLPPSSVPITTYADYNVNSISKNSISSNNGRANYSNNGGNGNGNGDDSDNESNEYSHSHSQNSSSSPSPPPPIQSRGYSKPLPPPSTPFHQNNNNDSSSSSSPSSSSSLSFPKNPLPSKYPMSGPSNSSSLPSFSSSSASSSTSPSVSPPFPISSSFGSSSSSPSSSSPSPSPFSMSALTHLVSEVGDQSDAGLYIAKRIGNVMKQICALEENFGRSILKVMDYELTKSHKISKDRILSGAQAWRDAQSIVREWGQMHINNSQKVMMDCTVPVLEFFQSGTSRRKEVETEERKLTKELVVQKMNVNNDLLSCQRLLVQANALQRKDMGLSPDDDHSQFSNAAYSPAASSSALTDEGMSGTRDTSVSATSKASAFLSKMAKKVTKGVAEFTLLSPEQLREKIYQSALKYTKTIDTANAYQYHYYQQDIPRVLSQLENLERSRLSTSSSSLNQWMAILRENNPNLRSYLEKIPIAVKPIDVDTQIKMAVEGWIHVFGHSPPITTFSYQLPCLLHDIQAGRYSGSPNSVFHTTLAHCMKLQITTYPELKIPRVLQVLSGRLTQFNDFHHEGLFRISPMKSELDDLRKKIEKNDLNMIMNDQQISPHCTATMIKEWLRSLSDPLINDKYYPLAMEIGKVELSLPNDGNSGLLPNGSAAHYSEQKNVMEFYNTLDPTVRNVLLCLAGLWVRVLDPNMQRTNKMSVEALSIVFAPCFVRTTSMDPNIVLANVKFETKFTAAIMKQMMRVVAMGGQ